MLARWRLLCCAHPQDNAVKIELVVSTLKTPCADTEVVTQAVQLPHLAPSTPVQGGHQVPGDRIVADFGRGDPIGCV
jgi:hydrogenase maturation factor HypE